jgi:MHS family proline/betaine transporter-like MFS transporter
VIGLVALAIRLRVQETPMFERLRADAGLARQPLRDAIRAQPRGIFVAFAMSSFIAVSYYLVVSFVPTYLQSFIGMAHVQALTIATLATLLNIVVVPVPAWLSDRIGRKPVLTPLLAAWLIHTTGNLTAPAWYLILASLAILAVSWRIKETYRAEPA